MLRSKDSQLILGLLILALAACTPASAASSTVEQIAAPAQATTVPATPASMPQSTALLPMKVAGVEMQIGVGSPIPVDAFISAELPDICAQLADVKVTQRDFAFDITLTVTPGTREECFRDTLPFRLMVPLNMVNATKGTYTVKVNDVSATFTWPSQPTIMPEPAIQTYHNSLVGFEFDYPLGWLLDNAGVDMLWSEHSTGTGKGGVPENIAKVDVIAEVDKTMTLEELVARQKKDLTPNQIKSEESVTLPSGLPAVRLQVSAFADSLSLLTIINGHPVTIVNYGDVSHFDDIISTLRPVQ